MFKDDVIIDLADGILEHSKTYGEALLLIREVEKEVHLRALEQEV